MSEVCRVCGVCGEGIMLKRAESEKGESRSVKVDLESWANRLVKMRLRIKYSRRFPASYMSSPETIESFVRAMRRAEVPLRFRGAFNPRPCVSSGPALPVGVESLEEYIDVELTEEVPPEKISYALKRELAFSGIEIVECREIPLDEPSIESATLSSVYRISCEDMESFESIRKAVESLQLSMTYADENRHIVEVELPQRNGGARSVLKILENARGFPDILEKVEMVKVKHNLKY